jgi:hypothetical protein
MAGDKPVTRPHSGGDEEHLEGEPSRELKEHLPLSDRPPLTRRDSAMILRVSQQSAQTKANEILEFLRSTK